MALLDMSLPGMDGEELGRRIAADPQLKQTALVLMTGFRTGKATGARLRALGFAGHVSKPIWERSLREALARAGREAKRDRLRPPSMSFGLRAPVRGERPGANPGGRG